MDIKSQAKRGCSLCTVSCLWWLWYLHFKTMGNKIPRAKKHTRLLWKNWQHMCHIRNFNTRTHSTTHARRYLVRMRGYSVRNADRIKEMECLCNAYSLKWMMSCLTWVIFSPRNMKRKRQWECKIKQTCECIDYICVTWETLTQGDTLQKGHTMKTSWT